MHKKLPSNPSVDGSDEVPAPFSIAAGAKKGEKKNKKSAFKNCK